jgi:hypothetical protein
MRLYSYAYPKHFAWARVPYKRIVMILTWFSYWVWAHEIFHLVFVILRPLYSFMMNSVAWPDGSIINGYLLNLFNMMAFSVQRSSEGRALACHASLSSAVDRYYLKKKLNILDFFICNQGKVFQGLIRANSRCKYNSLF